MILSEVRNPEYLAIPIFVIITIVCLTWYFGRKIFRWTEEARQIKEILDKESHKKGQKYEDYRKRLGLTR
ncbi:MAG: hypothetical protein ACYS3N_12560 [Planctomycetota bacterium]|jgi:hypothetical protein